MSRETPSLRYLVRVMDVMSGRQQVSITNLALMARLNHRRCTELVYWLVESGYCEIITENKNRMVRLTDSGFQYGLQLLKVNSMTDTPEKNALGTM